MTLDMLVVVPAGNDGQAGPSYGSIAGPGGAQDALTVAASDARASICRPSACRCGRGCVLFEGVAARRRPVGDGDRGRRHGHESSRGGRDRGVLRPGRRECDRRPGVAAAARRALEEAVEEATAAGALAVLVDGLLPAGAFSLDVPAGVVVNTHTRARKEMFLGAGVPVTVAVGGVSVAENLEGGAIAAFSSRLALGGGLKPDLVAAGVAVPTSEPGRGDEGEVRSGTVSGTSAAAAVAAGAAAVLAEGRPRVAAAELRGLLVGSACASTSTSRRPARA